MKIMVCRSVKQRFIGLMFKKKKINYGLCFPNCNSIHTFFMFQNIDVVAVSKSNNILKIYHSVKPWRILIVPKKTYYIFELPSNTKNIEDIIKNHFELK